MLKKVVTISLLSLLLKIFASANTINTMAQWQCIGPEGGGIDEIVEYNGKLFAGGYKLLHHSDNRGEIWSTMDIPFTIRNIAVKGDTLYAIANRRDSVLWRSTDDGKTWKNIFHDKNVDISDFASPRVFNAINGAVFFRARGHFYKSTDGGDTWNVMSTPVGSNAFNPYRIVHFDDTIIAAGNCGNPRFGTEGTDAWIYRSTDSGETWTYAAKGISGSNVNALAVKNNLVFAGTDDALFVSSDYGMDWNKLDRGLDQIFALETVGDYLLCGRSNGLYFSENDGEDWSRISVSAEFDDTVTTFGTVPNAGYYTRINEIVHTENGDIFISVSATGFLFKSTGNILEWVRCDKGMHPFRDIHRLSSYKNNLYTVDRWNRLYQTSTRGNIWQEISRLANATPVTCIYRSNDYFLIGTTDGVLKSIDLGYQWFDFSNGINNHNNNVSVQVNSFTEIDDTLFVSSGYRLFHLVNNGTQWEQLADAGLKGPVISNKQRLFAGPRLYTSDSYGRNWNTVSDSPGFIALTAYDNIVYAARRTGEMYISIDNGNSWSVEKCPIIDNYSVSYNLRKLLAATATMVFAGTSDSGVYVSPDTAKTWFSIKNGMFPRSSGEIVIRSLSIQEDRYLYAATEDGVYMMDIMALDSSAVFSRNIAGQTRNPGIRVITENRNYFTVIVPLNKGGVAKVTIFDLQGRQLFNNRYRNNGTPLRISIPVKSAGLHILEVVTPYGNHRVPVTGYK